MTHKNEMTAYISQLNPMEQKILQIAASHLETSFSLAKSIGFQEWQQAPAQQQAQAQQAQAQQAQAQQAQAQQAQAQQEKKKIKIMKKKLTPTNM